MQDKPKISIILPAIRQDRWDGMYESLLSGCKKYTFELIICGPLPLTEKLQNDPRVKYAKDLGSPTRCSNIAAELAEGELVTWIADDALVIEDSIDKNIDELLSMGESDRNVVIYKYYEGKNGTDKALPPDYYYLLNSSGNFSPYIEAHWFLFNNPGMYRSFFEELGGLDCFYEACPMAHNDLAARAQNLGAVVKITQFPVLDCDHMEGGTVDHMAIFVSQTHRDQPKYQGRYRNPNWRTDVQMRIPMDNWKLQPQIWTQRFKRVPTSYADILKMNEETPNE